MAALLGRKSGRRLVLSVVAASVVLMTGTATATPAGSSRQTVARSAAEPTGNACTDSTATDKATRAAAKGAGENFNIVGFLKDKAGPFLAKKGLDMGYHLGLKLTGLDKILPKSENELILDQLSQIKEQLSEITARLDVLTEKVDQVIKEARTKDFNDTLGFLCGIYNKQFTFYKLYYKPMIAADVTLGDLLKVIGDPNSTDNQKQEAQAKLSNAQQVADTADKAFYNNYNTSVYESQSADVYDRLVPGSLSLLSRYGLMAMSKRFLTHSDSESLRELYDEFAQVEAMASWMDAEYHSNDLGPNPEPGENAETTILKDFQEQSARELSRLPKMIPPGAVIDLGKLNATSTDGEPMWYPVSTDDQEWWPDNSGYHVPAVNDVDNVIRALNARPADQQIAGTGWAVPTQQELVALTSSGCLAQQKDPSKYVDPKVACKSALTDTVGAYLRNLDPSNITWQTLFCQSDARITCAGGAGPNYTAPHAWIWMTGTTVQTMHCGYTIFPPGQSARNWTTHVGFWLGAKDPGKARVGIPRIPDKVPGYALEDPSIGHQICDSYMHKQVFGPPPPSPDFKAIVLATRFSGEEDMNGNVDYMAQLRKSTLTRVIVKAIDAGRKLFVNININLGPGYWTFKVEKLVNSHWRTVGSYRSRGKYELRRIALPRGTYRVVVLPKYRYSGVTSQRVRLSR